MGNLAVSIQNQGKGLLAPMDDRFGRAPRFLIVDRDSHQVLWTVVNSAQDASHGAGPQTASLMKDYGVEAVVSGRYGPKAAEALEALGIQALIAPTGLTAGEALLMRQDGRLERHALRTYR
jgi:predicted Fe-Mo cluster-binding NifX family protein